MNELKASLEQRPELKERLKEDFKGTLVAEGIVIDDAFRENVRQQWRAMIESDLREFMDKQPDDKKLFYTMVRAGKPLKVRVKIDPTTGKRSVTLGVDA